MNRRGEPPHDAAENARAGGSGQPLPAADRPWREHHDHVPREFDEGSRRAHYRSRGDHQNDHIRTPGPAPRSGHRGAGNLGPERPDPRGPAQPVGAPDLHAATSGYDDYEAESLYGRGFDDGDWARTWRRGARGSTGAMQGSHRGRGPEGYRRSDERLLEEVSERIRDDPYVDGRQISLSVQDGVVHLEGEVEARWIKHHLEHIAARCFGVGDVDNRVRVVRREQ